MIRIKYIQIPLPEETIEQLKKKTRKKTNKDAIMEAIEHYLKCPCVEKEIKP